MDGFSSFFVVVNAEEQYSLWPDELELPAGWSAVFGPSEKATCLEWVERTWTDMRPRSAREASVNPSGGTA
jgi:uncharacterized protein YbdZ (MbtH family)